MHTTLSEVLVVGFGIIPYFMCDKQNSYNAGRQGHPQYGLWTCTWFKIKVLSFLIHCYQYTFKSLKVYFEPWHEEVRLCYQNSWLTQ